MGQGVLEQCLSGRQLWKVEMVWHRPNEKFKQQRAWAMKGQVTGGLALPGEKQVPLAEGHSGNSTETVADVLGFQICPMAMCVGFHLGLRATSQALLISIASSHPTEVNCWVRSERLRPAVGRVPWSLSFPQYRSQCSICSPQHIQGIPLGLVSCFFRWQKWRSQGLWSKWFCLVHRL
jgi:hypothetical protein